MGSPPVAPDDQFYHLDVASDSYATIDAIRSGLTALGDGRENLTLDAATEAKLAPFSSMFQFERIKSPVGIGHLLMLLYAPIGIVLLFLRGTMLFLLALTMPRCLSEQQLDRLGLHRVAAWLTGTVVLLEDAHHFDFKAPADVIVANHISEFDAVAVRALLPSYVLGYDFYKKMLFFRLLGDKFGLVYVPYASRNQGGAHGRDAVRDIIMDKLEKRDKPLVVFPEVRLTGRDLEMFLRDADSA
jgi:hypothetical protein